MKFRKLLTLFTLLLLCGTAWADGVPWEGDGTVDSPYLIKNTDDLNELATQVNAGTENGYAGKYFKLANDIKYSTEGLANNASNFTAIGKEGAQFQGNFDGDGKTISGIQIYLPEGNCQGLFGYTFCAQISNVTLASSSITAKSYCGGIVGNCMGDEENFSTISNCEVGNDVTLNATDAESTNFGGIVGFCMDTNIENCRSSVKITVASGDNVYRLGGIAGNAVIAGVNNNIVDGAVIPYCKDNYGAIAGSMMMYWGKTTISNNYYLHCTVAGVKNAVNVGCSNKDIPADNQAVSIHTLTLGNDIATTTDATITIDGTKYYAHGTDVKLTWKGVYADNYVYTAADGDKYYGKLIMPAKDVEINSAEKEDIWGSETANADGSEENPYIITNTDDLNLLATRVNAGNTFENTYFVLAEDIEYVPSSDEVSNFTTIGVFGGHFDGQGHTISGIRIYNPNEQKQGLFGELNTSAKVANITLENTKITGKRLCGGIVGNNWGNIDNCKVGNNVYIHAALTYDNDPNRAYDANYVYCGGIAGENNRIITNCTSSAQLSIKDDKCSHIGGIVGKNFSGMLTNNRADGAIVPECKDNTYYGAILGEGITDYVTKNYYKNCKVAEKTNATDVGCGSETGVSDVSKNDGAVAVKDFPKTEGAITTVEYFDDKKTVFIDGNYKGSNAFTISSPITNVKRVELNREFTEDVYSTIVLPFEASVNTEDGHYFTFVGVKFDKTTNKWIADVSEVSTITAHTPYLFKPNGEKNLLSWNVSTVEKAAEAKTSSTDEHGTWTLVGVYEQKTWDVASKTDFGFAGAAQTTSGKNISPGDFVRAGKGAKLQPFRCHLQYSEGTSKAAFELPTSIEVRIIASVIDPNDDPNIIDNPDDNGDIETPVSEVERATSSAKVWSYDKTIFIEAAANSRYQVIDLGGKVLKNDLTTSTREEINIGGKGNGIVIVKIGGKAYKVIY